MKAIYLVRTGDAAQAFEQREVPTPKPGLGEVLIKVEAFGLNFADVMARLGLYPDAPPLPAVIGYDIVGRIEEVGEGVNPDRIGERITALCRFGGYAEYALTPAIGAIPIGNDMDSGTGLSLAVQGATAIYMAEEMVRLHEGEHVLIHAAAGGVGSLLVQFARHKGCVIYGTAGSQRKLDFLRDLGVDHPINYREKEFATEIRSIRGEDGLDIVFDPIGGKSLKQGFKLLRAGGRIVAFGGSSMTQAKNIFSKIRIGLSFGIYHPVAFLSNSRSMLGVNMLRISDQRPELSARALRRTVELAKEGILQPLVGGRYPASQIGDAHAFLESRQSMGKVIVEW
ncbi:MAG: zinc-binding dehydrogenase [Bacteroidota bacterium]